MVRPFARLALTVLVAGCDAHRAPVTHDDAHVAAAHALTRRYAASADRTIDANAAGGDCTILLVHVHQLVEESTIEAIHYGAGKYELDGGGVRRFMRDRAFRGVAYTDVSGRVWTYGDVTRAQAEELVPCE
jgi:hypothetical protein